MIERFELGQPDWASAELEKLPEYLPDVQGRMDAVIRFSRLNIEFGTGGPFAAGVFETVSGRLVTIGVNRVVHHQCSSAHAEVMALSLAQQTLGGFDLGAEGMPEHQLVVNWRRVRCVMARWSGRASVHLLWPEVVLNWKRSQDLTKARFTLTGSVSWNTAG